MGWRQDDFCRWVLLEGDSATYTAVTGDACPCMAWRSPGYSPEWHRLNSESDACNGTGLINTSTETTSIKGFFYRTDIHYSFLTEDQKIPIGELQDADVVLFGQVNATTGAFVDLSSANVRADKITLDSVDYEIRKILEPSITGRIGQMTTLKRKS